MNMRNDIRLCRKLQGMRRGLPWSTFEFHPRFSGFVGHFPGRPVLPGVCMLMAAAVTLEDWHGRGVRIQEVRKARFLSFVMPGQSLEVECAQSEDSADGFTARMTLRGQADHKASGCLIQYTLASS